ncbi:MAG: LamG-like jellyroll fold domain-containing protein [Candidatus Micrarchaeia archaeon]
MAQQNQFRAIFIAFVALSLLTGIAHSYVDPLVSSEISKSGRAPVVIILSDTSPLSSPSMSEAQKDSLQATKRAIYSTAQNRLISSRKLTSVKAQYSSFNGFAASLDSAQLSQLASDPSVQDIYYDRPFYGADSAAWPMINVTPAYSVQVNGVNSTGVGKTICLLDTGVNYNQSDFGGCSGAAAFAAGTCAKFVGGYDFINSDSDPMDDNNHGTHIAGIINRTAPGARIAVVKVLDSSNSGTLSSILSGIDWCNSNRAAYNISVISMSITDNAQYNTSCSTGFSSSLNTAKSNGIFVAVASGNNHFTSGVSSPACEAAAFSVGAVYASNYSSQTWSTSPGTCTDSSPQADQLACFTNYGPNLDILAPGAIITSTYRLGGTLDMGGTSQATPFVSAAVAIVQSELGAQGRSLTPDQIYQKLNQTGKRVQVNGYSYPRLNVYPFLAASDTFPAEAAYSGSTPANNSNITATSVQISGAFNKAVSSAMLEWNGTSNETLQLSGTSFNASAKSNLSYGLYSYRVWSNDSFGNAGFGSTYYVLLSPPSKYPAGLVSYWPFDSNANDAMGLNNGAVSGASLTSSAGKVGGAYVFNGLVNVSYSPSLNLSSAGTLSFWIKPRWNAYNYANHEIFLDYNFWGASGSGLGCVFRPTDYGTGGIDCDIVNSSTIGANVYFNTQNWSANEWHHIAFAYDIPGHSRSFYVDGALVSSSTAAITGFALPAKPLYIGKGYNGYSSFNGTIDEVAIFNRSLNGTEISLLYNNSRDGIRNYFGDCGRACPGFGAGNAANGSVLQSNSLFANVTVNASTQLRDFVWNWNGTNYSLYDSSLMGMWGFEGPIYSDAFNAASLNTSRWSTYGTAAVSGNRLVTTTAATTWSYGQIMSTYRLSGDFDIQVDYDASAWGTPTDGYQASLQVSGTSYSYECDYFRWSGSMEYASWDSQISNRFGSLIVASTPVGKMRMTRVGTIVSCYYYNSTTGGWTYYGYTNVTGASNQNMQVKIFTLNRNNAKSITTYFDNFIVNKGELAGIDSGARGNNITGLYNAASGPGEFGSGLYLDGNSQYVNASDMFYSNKFTVSAWVKPTAQCAAATTCGILGKRLSPQNEWRFTLNAGLPALAGWDSGQNVIFNTQASTAVPAGTWSHVVAVLNATNVSIYVNGALSNTGPVSGTLADTASPVQIGTDSMVAGRFFNGTIDEVRIYNRSFSSEEVRQLYYSNLKKINSTSWEFDTNLTNLSDGTYAYGAYAADIAGYSDTTGMVSVRLSYNPVVSNYGGATTDFTALADLGNVTNLTLEKPGKGRIRFPPTHGVNTVSQDYDSNVVIGSGFVSVNSSALDPSFNSSTTITLNLTGVYSKQAAPDIYYYSGVAGDLSTIQQNGVPCTSPRCTGISWDQADRLLAFNATGFSGYGIYDNNTGAQIAWTNNGTIGINITSTNQIAVYTSNGANDSTFSFVSVTPPAAGSITLMSNETSNTTGGELGFLVENQGNVNVSITVASDKDAAGFIGGSAPLFRMFGSESEAGSCAGINQSMQDLGTASITVCPGLAFNDASDRIWAYVLVKIDSDSPPQTSTATLTFTSTQA